MQVSVVNNVAVPPKGGGSFSGNQTDAGGFDTAMAAVMALLSQQPAQTRRPANDSGNADDNKVSSGTGRDAFVDPLIVNDDLPEDSMQPALSQPEPQVTGQGAQLTVGETGQASVPGTLPDATQIMPAASLPEIPVDQPTGLAGQTQPVFGANVETASAGVPVSAGIPLETPETGMMTGEGQNAQAIMRDNSAAAAQQPADAAKTTIVVISQAANAPNSLGASGEYPAVQDMQPNSVPSGQAAGAANAAGTPAEDGMEKNLQDVSNIKNANPAVNGANAGEMKNVAAGTIAAEDSRLTAEKKTVTVVSENTVLKPDGGSQSGVASAEQQRNAQLAYQGGNENKLPNDKPKGAQTADESKNVIINNAVASEKVEAGNGLGTNNTADARAQFSAQVSTTDSAKGVALSDLRDRVLQEIRHIYNTSGGDRQTQVQLKLEPEQLGQLTIKLYFHKGELNAHFYTANNSVKEVLEGSLQQLRVSLDQQDLKLNEAFVFVGNGSQDSSNLYYERSNEGGAVHYGSGNYRIDGDIPAESPQAGGTGTGSWQVNYLV
ncbi:flagellar hook-length control protein FliK [Pelotomaculum terephthalicicum JT]|uniref:flagellar hook-length control protein FliK n=1 Tax=Pelotomaculum terephthalicicum TaxID=206393 RepID=UPI001F04A414|nr:flagellar hook-length control protein FliK [Pelotomaculum terephthalicicum]MCG9967977.1 flagellar hook-length control protein FliK [Pelotomaculum terephthalicicum JT]